MSIRIDHRQFPDIQYPDAIWRPLAAVQYVDAYWTSQNAEAFEILYTNGHEFAIFNLQNVIGIGDRRIPIDDQDDPDVPNYHYTMSNVHSLEDAMERFNEATSSYGD
jgi:hypothetical protein